MSVAPRQAPTSHCRRGRALLRDQDASSVKRFPKDDRVKETFIVSSLFSLLIGVGSDGVDQQVPDESRATSLP